MSILFCTPCYGGQLTEPYFHSCMMLKEFLTAERIPHNWLTGANESLVHRARNEMTRTFLQGTPYERMMWIDADIEFSPDDVAKLWNMDTDIAVGIYPMKRPGEDWYAAWVDGALVKDLDSLPNPCAVDFAGTGFMMIKRSVLESMIEAHPETEYEGPHGKTYALYQTPIVDKHFDSEDYHFCRTWRAMGGQVMADPSVRLVHHGSFGYGSR